MRQIKAIVKKLGRQFGIEISRYQPEIPPAARLCTELFPHWIARLRQGGPLQVVFDVGANRGQSVAHFRGVLPESTIYAFEPGEAAFAKLHAQAASDPAVRTLRMAVGDRDGEATLYENAANVTNSLLQNASRISEFAPAAAIAPVGTSPTSVTRIDTFCATHSIRRIDLLKIDTQGYERHVLEGAGKMLAPGSIRGIYMEMLFAEYYRDQAWAGELMELLRARGYRLFGVGEVAFDSRNGWTAADVMFLGESA